MRSSNERSTCDSYTAGGRLFPSVQHESQAERYVKCSRDEVLLTHSREKFC